MDLFELPISPGLNLDLAYFPEAWGGFGVNTGLEFLMLPIVTKSHMEVLAAGFGPGFNQPLGQKADFYIRTQAGYCHFRSRQWEIEGIDGSSFILRAGAGGSLRFGNVLSLGLGGFYGYYDKLYNGIGVTLYGQLDFGRGKGTIQDKPVRDYTPEEKITPLDDEMPKPDGKGVELYDFNLTTLFPVLYKYYDANPVGSVIIRNFEDIPAEEVTVKFYMERYMDNPMKTGESFTLQPGEEGQRAADALGLSDKVVWEEEE